ncbi:MAG TPA: VOC family protein [Jatrophihabitantaceae bacterium]|jgi:predicted enzyme related to lactoylglutathione lyase
MVVWVRNITVDSKDAYSQAQFWSELTGWPIDPDNVPGDAECLVAPTHPLPFDAPISGLLFVQVPEGKVAKNRIHLDLSPTDRTRDEEVVRLQALGAMIVGDHRTPDGRGWVVMADPEANEFCVERSTAERGIG